MVQCSLFNKMLLSTLWEYWFYSYVRRTVVVGCDHAFVECIWAVRHTYSIIRHMHNLYSMLSFTVLALFFQINQSKCNCTMWYLMSLEIQFMEISANVCCYEYNNATATHLGARTKMWIFEMQHFQRCNIIGCTNEHLWNRPIRKDVRWSVVFRGSKLQFLCHFILLKVILCLSSQLPTIIADNAGYDSAALVSELRALHTEGQQNMGLGKCYLCPCE